MDYRTTIFFVFSQLKLCIFQVLVQDEGDVTYSSNMSIVLDSKERLPELFDFGHFLILI